MKKLFWGFFFIYIDFHLDINAVRIGLIPTFVGYLLLLGGISELMAENPHFERVRTPSIVMAVYTGILYVCDLFGLGLSMPYLISILLSIISCVLSYYISYHVIEGVIEIETRNSYPLDAARLKTAWLVLVVTHAISCAAAYADLGVIALLGMIVFFIYMICFLCFFGHTKNLYYRMKEAQAAAQAASDADASHFDNP